MKKNLKKLYTLPPVVVVSTAGWVVISLGLLLVVALIGLAVFLFFEAYSKRKKDKKKAILFLILGIVLGMVIPYLLLSNGVAILEYFDLYDIIPGSINYSL